MELERAKALKQELVDFVLDAEDELAVALESFSAAQLSRQPQPFQQQQTEMHRREFVVDRFVVEGKVGNQTPIDLFVQQSDLTPEEQQLLQHWRRSFMGLFAIKQVLPDGFELVNWTTSKVYLVKLAATEKAAAARLKVGDILLTQISPVSGLDWMFGSKWIALGKLGKPKLAVAIGNFKQNYKDHLYSDAPELLAEAWKSVERYHQQFSDFFGSNEVTMSGYQLGKKLAEFQEAMTEKQLEESGIDRSKSLEEIAIEAGLSQAEIEAAAAELGADAKAINQVLSAKQPAKMMAPVVELPPHLKKAEQVTVLTHPRWGQVFLPNYVQFQSALESADQGDTAKALARKYLDDPMVLPFIWHRLAQQYPQQLEALLQQVLEQPDFSLDKDLNATLAAAGKSLETELPEIASVPLHLHNLFQEAVLEVSKDKTKKKAKPKTATGFQR